MKKITPQKKKFQNRTNNVFAKLWPGAKFLKMQKTFCLKVQIFIIARKVLVPLLLVGDEQGW